MAKETVLIVDDDPTLLLTVSDALEAEGYHVLLATRYEALGSLRKWRPDVILLDVRLPGVDGVEVSRRLRANPVTAGVPIILMSGQDRLATLKADLPVNGHLPKPFDLTRLYATVARAIGASASSNRSSRHVGH